MGVAMSTLIGWVVVLSVVGYLLTRNKSSHSKPTRLEPQRQRQERQAAIAKKEQKEPKGKRNRVGTTAPPAPKTKAKVTAAAPVPATRETTYADSTDDDALDNREFARQLANVKQGTKFAPKKKDETWQKSVKQSRAEERIEHPSAPSSTAGIDADDDRSSAASPVIAATEAGNVDDMLEKPAPGPSVLRLTGTDESKPSSKNKTPKPSAAPAETKKQRQNRKKAEAAKAAREEAEKDRKVKLEQQRRQARIAEGRPAKDGSAFMAAQAKSNAWKSNGVNGKASAPNTNGFVPVQPLDTFDTNAAVAATPEAATSSLTKAAINKTDDWMATLPSEEEQMEMLRKEDDDDTWNTVKPKARKPKNKENGPDNAKAAASVPMASTPAAPVAVAPPPATTAIDKKKAGKVFTQQSAFAALSIDGAGDDDEQEHEWDV